MHTLKEDRMMEFSGRQRTSSILKMAGISLTPSFSIFSSLPCRKTPESLLTKTEGFVREGGELRGESPLSSKTELGVSRSGSLTSGFCSFPSRHLSTSKVSLLNLRERRGREEERNEEREKGRERERKREEKR